MREAPHFAQNFAPGFTGDWHSGQVAAPTAAPHSGQNLAFSGTGLLQEEQFFMDELSRGQIIFHE
jgi:hypothetical protein